MIDTPRTIPVARARKQLAALEAARELGERLLDRESLHLYAGTNLQSPAVRRMTATTMNGRPSLGDPGDKYETGLSHADEIERTAVVLLKQVFGAAYVEHRVLSGSMANLYAFMAVCAPGDTIFAMPVEAAGHVTHHAEGAAGLYRLNVVPIPCHPGTHVVDWAACADLAEQWRPRLLVLGTSLPLIPFDVAAARRLAAPIGARVMYDAAHVAGLIAGGAFQDPLAEGADIITMSTYKSFGGPAGGLVLTNDAELYERLRAIAHPGLTANFDLARLGGTAVAALEMLAFGGAYARQSIANAERLAEELRGQGLPVWSPDDSGLATRSHLVAVEAERWGGGTSAARRAEVANVLFSGIPLPGGGNRSDYAGIRLATHELTRWGMCETEMQDVARLLVEALTAPPEQLGEVRDRVIEFRQGYQEMVFVLD